MVDNVTLESVFTSFCGGKTTMTNKEFLKINKDCGLFDKKYTTTDIDINFVKVKDKTSKVISFSQFEQALKLAATKKGIDITAVNEMILKTGGPSFTGTKTDNVRLHDDKSTYTGVYAKGGPTNVDNNNISDISQTCNRSEADVRGNKK